MTIKRNLFLESKIAQYEAAGWKSWVQVLRSLAQDAEVTIDEAAVARKVARIRTRETAKEEERG